MTYETRPPVVLEFLRVRCRGPKALVVMRRYDNGEVGPPELRYAPPGGPSLN